MLKAKLFVKILGNNLFGVNCMVNLSFESLFDIKIIKILLVFLQITQILIKYFMFKFYNCQEEKEYRRLTKNVRNHLTADDAPISVQMKELNAILISLVQFIVSVGCAFTFGFMAPYLFYGNESVGVRILCGTVIGIIVGIADLYFVIRETLHNEGFVVKKIE